MLAQFGLTQVQVRTLDATTRNDTSCEKRRERELVAYLHADACFPVQVEACAVPMYAYVAT